MIVRRFLVFTAVVALTLLVFQQLAFSGLILARGDTFAYFYPYWAARDAVLSQGALPLWSPDIFMGVPLLSDPQIGTFYPPNWLSAFFGWTPPDAVRVSVLLHVAWAILGAYGLARHAGKVGVIPALIAGAMYGLGGFVGAHVEQINQLQGLAWLPWAFLAYHRGFEQPLRYTPLLGIFLALQLFSGHTQTTFITGFGLVLYGLSTVLLDIRAIGFPAPDDWRRVMWRRVMRVVLVLVVAVVLAVVLALPQLIPTLELTGLSNRGGGFNPQQAMAFSWEPALAGRGLLPSYDAQIFGEYIAYVGVAGLGLALLGAFSDGRRRAAWVIVALVGIFFAFGLYNPLYWQATGLPGFNLFRVPARWLALYALGAAMLGGMGAQYLIETQRRIRLRSLWGIGVILSALALSTLLAGQAQSLVDGPAVPGVLTWAAWAVVVVLLVNLVLLRAYLSPVLLGSGLLLLVTAELIAASRVMPYNDLVDPAAYEDRRLTAYHLVVVDECAAGECPPGRSLVISSLYFDPGDKSGLEAHYAALDMSERAVRYGLVATKLKEVLAPNLPMAYGLPSIDGFGGGLLPTSYYTAFTSLLLPEGTPRTIDGRLRELLAREACRGACVPEERWLTLTDTRYLILDKTFDPWHDGVAYDTALRVMLAADESWRAHTLPAFTADEVRVLFTGLQPPSLSLDTQPARLIDADATVDGLRLARYQPGAPVNPAMLMLQTRDAITLYALTLVDTRTGDFAQMTPGRWQRVLSSDIKIYENRAPSARAFVVHESLSLPDSWDGSEQALDRMRMADFDPARTVILHREETGAAVPDVGESVTAEAIRFTAYTAERVELQVELLRAGYLVLADAYFPGWRATLNGEPTEIIRANVMFRALEVPPGRHTVVFEYQPNWLRWLPLLGVVLWAVVVAITAAIWNQRLSALETHLR